MMARMPDTKTVNTTCPYCGVGCGIKASRDRDGSVSVTGDPTHPANFGRLCSKGVALGETVDLEGRLLAPEIDDAPATWDAALSLVAERFNTAIAEHGPDSVAFYVSGQLLTEDYYVANKLMKGFIGSANIDTNSRLCMASSVAGHRRAFGSDTVPGCYEDLELADLIVLVGSNLAWCHPVLHQRILAAKSARPDMKLVVIDPRRTVTADIADLHLAIDPDGDVALFCGLLSHLATAGVLDEAYVADHTEGFAAALATAEIALPQILAQTGLTSHEIEHFYELFATTEKAVTLYSQGVNQSVCGTDKVNAIINCHLATGRIGRPGMGPFSITGQPNAMGGREVGGLANMLACHMELEREDHRTLVQDFWQSPAIPDRAGLKAVDLFQAMAEGRIKALWIMATNPVDSLPDADEVKAAIASCPFVVVSDLLAKTDSTQNAQVKLPSAAWGEKDGTVTNSERRISRQRAFLPLPGEARPDWWQLAQVARRMGHAEAFSYPDVASIFREYAALSAYDNAGTRDLDIGACADMSSEAYDRLQSFQWPRPKGGPAGQTRFFAQGGFYTANRKARFIPVTPTTELLADKSHQLLLNSGRVRDHWHTMTRTGKSAQLSAHTSEPFAELHPEDAMRLGVSEASIVEVSSGAQKVCLRAMITRRQKPGRLFVPMHWNDLFASAARINTLVPPVTDPYSGQPALKNAHVSVRPFKAAVYGFAVSAEKPDPGDCDYWALARCKGGWRLEFALAEHMPAIEAFALRLFGLGAGLQPETLAYSDRQKNDSRQAGFDAGRLLYALYLASEPVVVSRLWAVGQLTGDHSQRQSRYRIIAGRPGEDGHDPGATVCSCFGVGAKDIVTAVRAGCASVDEIGRVLNAGTNCGSCRSEIQEIVNGQRVLAAE